MTAPADPTRGTRARAARPAGGDGAGPPRGRSPVAADPTPSTPAGASDAPAGATADAPAPGLRVLGPDELAALEEQRDFLLGSLRDLDAEHDAGDVDEADYLALKDDYTARAA